MTDFSIKEAALSGFRFTRENPLAILVWAVVTLASTFLAQWILISMAGEAQGHLQSMQADPQAADPTAMFEALGQVLRASAVALIPALIASAVISGAAIRGILRPESGGLGYLRFGSDELRLIVVLIVTGAIFFAIYFAGSTVAGIIVVVTAIASGEPPTPGEMNGSLLAVMAPVLLVTGLIILYMYGRFSLATPLTVDRKAINIFSSVAMTKGRGGRLFRTYLLAVCLYLVVFLLGGLIFAGVAAAMTGNLADLQNFIMQPDMSSMQAFMTPLRVIYLLLMSVIGALGAAILLTPAATIYKDLTADGVDEVY